MKSVCRVLLGSLMALCCSVVFAASIEQRLQDEVTDYRQRIDSETGAQLVATADLLSGSGLSDTGLFDSVEARLLDYHQTQLMAEKQNIKIYSQESLALLRALGSSGWKNTGRH